MLIPGAAAVLFLYSENLQAAEHTAGHPHTFQSAQINAWMSLNGLFSPPCSLNSPVGKADGGYIAFPSVWCWRQQTKIPGNANPKDAVSFNL